MFLKQENLLKLTGIVHIPHIKVNFNNSKFDINE